MSFSVASALRHPGPIISYAICLSRVSSQSLASFLHLSLTELLKRNLLTKQYFHAQAISSAQLRSYFVLKIFNSYLLRSNEPTMPPEQRRIARHRFYLQRGDWEVLPPPEKTQYIKLPEELYDSLRAPPCLPDT
ncbi:hypothetical protein FB451DRAFT_1393753 [Mycena latifolia]|nr:hypothetical protein FB451DRAFT_1393753 [Mycena latifolia]